MKKKSILYDAAFGLGVDVKLNNEGKFVHRERDDRGSILLPKQRGKGFAYSLKSGLVKELRLFCPKNESEVMFEVIKSFGGIYDEQLIHHDTDVTTYANGRVMHTTLAKLDLHSYKVCMISSGYHWRSHYFGSRRHDLHITCIPAEAWFFIMAETDAEKNVIEEELIADYGDNDFVVTFVRDMRGIATDLQDQYVHKHLL